MGDWFCAGYPSAGILDWDGEWGMISFSKMVFVLGLLVFQMTHVLIVFLDGFWFPPIFYGSEVVY